MDVWAAMCVGVCAANLQLFWAPIATLFLLLGSTGKGWACWLHTGAAATVFVGWGDFPALALLNVPLATNQPALALATTVPAVFVFAFGGGPILTRATAALCGLLHKILKPE